MLRHRLVPPEPVGEPSHSELPQLFRPIGALAGRRPLGARAAGGEREGFEAFAERRRRFRDRSSPYGW